MNDKKFKNGYAIIDNDILTALSKTKLSGGQARIIFCILRATYGFNKESHNLSLSYIGSIVKMSDNNVSRETNKLIKRNILKVFEKDSYTKSRKIGLNNEISSWKYEGVIKSDNMGLSELIVLGYQNQQFRVIKSDNQNININNKKRETDTHLSSEENFETFWSVYKKHEYKERARKFWEEQNYDEETVEMILLGVECYNKENLDIDKMKSARYFLEDEIWKTYATEKLEYDSKLPDKERVKYLESLGVDMSEYREERGW